MKTIAAACVLVALVSADAALALPRFSARTGARCQSCHVNPSGGLMRQTFGVQYGREQLPVPEWSKEFEVEDFTNLLTNVLGVGADFRTLYYLRRIPDAQNASRTDHVFYQMQGSVYLNFRVAKKVNMFLNKDLGDRYEIFGLLSILPAHGYIKAGKFLPNYGTRLDDHTAFIRTYTGFTPAQSPELAGAEVGIAPGPLSITGGVYNAESRDLANGNKRAFLGRVEGLFTVSEGVNAGIGGNVFTRKSTTGIATTLLGGVGSFSYENAAVFGEIDQIRTTFAGVTKKALVIYIEADYVVTPGLDLKLAYDFYDPDTDVKNGAESRYSLGFEFFPITGVEVRPVYRIMKEQPTDRSNDEFHLMIHFYL